jgi:hypothetical protein
MKKHANKRSSDLELRKPDQISGPYGDLLNGVVRLTEEARLVAVRSVNAVLTSAYWMIG